MDRTDGKTSKTYLDKCRKLISFKYMNSNVSGSPKFSGGDNGIHAKTDELCMQNRNKIGNVATGIDVLRNIKTETNVNMKGRKEAINFIVENFNKIEVTEENAKGLTSLVQTVIQAISEDETEKWGFFKKLFFRQIYLLLDWIFQWKAKEIRSFISETAVKTAEIGRICHRNIETETKYELLPIQKSSAAAAPNALPNFIEPSDYEASKLASIRPPADVQAGDFTFLDGIEFEQLAGDFLLPRQGFRQLLDVFVKMYRAGDLSPESCQNLFGHDDHRGRAAKLLCILAMGGEFFLREEGFGGQNLEQYGEIFWTLKAFVSNAHGDERPDLTDGASAGPLKPVKMRAIAAAIERMMAIQTDHKIIRSSVRMEVKGDSSLLPKEDQEKLEELFQKGPEEFQNTAVKLFPGRFLMQNAATLGGLSSFLQSHRDTFPFDTTSHPLFESALVQLLHKHFSSANAAAGRIGNPYSPLEMDLRAENNQTPVDQSALEQFRFQTEFNAICVSLANQIIHLQQEVLDAKGKLAGDDLKLNRKIQYFYSKILLELLTVNDGCSAQLLDSDSIGSLRKIWSTRSEIAKSPEIKKIYTDRETAQTDILNLNFYGIAAFLSANSKTLKCESVDSMISDEDRIEFAALKLNPKFCLENCLAGDSEESINDDFNEVSNQNLRKFYTKETVKFLLNSSLRSTRHPSRNGKPSRETQKKDAFQKCVTNVLQKRLSNPNLVVDFNNGTLVEAIEGQEKIILAKHDNRCGIIRKLSNYEKRKATQAGNSISLVDDGLVSIDSATKKATHKTYGRFVELDAKTIAQRARELAGFLDQLVAFQRDGKTFLFFENDLSKPLLTIDDGSLYFDDGRERQAVYLADDENSKRKFGSAGLVKIGSDGEIERFISLKTAFDGNDLSATPQSAIYSYELAPAAENDSRFATSYHLMINGTKTGQYLAEPVDRTLFRFDDPMEPAQFDVPWLWSKKDGFLHSLDGNFVYDPEKETIVQMNEAAIEKFCDVFIRSLDRSRATNRKISETKLEDITESQPSEIVEAQSNGPSEISSDDGLGQVGEPIRIRPQFVRMLSQIVDRTCEDGQSALASLVSKKLLGKIFRGRVAEFESLLAQSESEDFELRNELAVLYLKMITGCDRIQRADPAPRALFRIRDLYDRDGYAREQGNHRFGYDHLFELLYVASRHDFAVNRNSAVRFTELKQFYEIFHQYRFMPLSFEAEYRRLKRKEREIHRLGDDAERAFVAADRLKPAGYYMNALENQTFDGTSGSLEVASYYAPDSLGGIHRAHFRADEETVRDFTAYANDIIDQVAGAEAFTTWNEKLQHYTDLVRRGAKEIRQALESDGHGPFLSWNNEATRQAASLKALDYLLSCAKDGQAIWMETDPATKKPYFVGQEFEIFCANLERELKWDRMNCGPLLNQEQAAIIRNSLVGPAESATPMDDDQKAMRAEIEKLHRELPFGEAERRRLFAQNFDALFKMENGKEWTNEEVRRILDQLEDTERNLAAREEEIAALCAQERSRFVETFQSQIGTQMAQMIAIGVAKMPKFDDLLQVWFQSLREGEFSPARFRELWKKYNPSSLDGRSIQNLHRAVQKYLFFQTELNAVLGIRAKLGKFHSQLDHMPPALMAIQDLKTRLAAIKNGKTTAEYEQQLSDRIDNLNAEIQRLNGENEIYQNQINKFETDQEKLGVRIKNSLKSIIYKKFTSGEEQEIIKNKGNIAANGKSIQSYQAKIRQLEQAKKDFSDLERELRQKEAAFETSKIELEQGWNDFVEQSQTERAYNPLNDSFLLWFEYKTGMRIRQSQIDVLQKLQSQIKVNGANVGIIFQLIMGGGKTSVILSQLAKLFADEGKVVIFANHHSQHESMLGNLIKFQRERYGQDVIEIDHSFAELMKNETLRDVLEKFKLAKKQSACIAMKSSFLRSILLFQVRQIKAVQDEIAQPRWTGWRDFFRGKKSDSEVKLALVSEIMDFIRDNCVQILDEVDLNLDPNYSVNVPAGVSASFFNVDGTSKKPDYKLEIIETIFRTLKGDAKLSEKFRASKALSIGDFRALAKIFEDGWKLSGDERQNIEKFLLQPLQPNADDAAEISEFWQKFLADEKLRLERAQKADGDEPSAAVPEPSIAEKIAFLRGMFETMHYGATHQHNQNYGFRLDANTLKVVPYRGSNTPSTGEFAHPLELSYFTYCSYFKDDVFANDRRHPLYRKIANLVAGAFSGDGADAERDWLSSAWPAICQAHSEAGKMGANQFNLPPQFMDAKKAFNKNVQEGVRDHMVAAVVHYVQTLRDEPGNLDRFFNFIQIASSGSFNLYPQIIEGTCYAQADMTDLAIGDTGTPWNRRILGEKFQNAERNYLDGTTEPLICDKILQDLNGNKSRIIADQNPTLENIIGQIGKGTRAVIDVAGFLKDYDNRLVARKIAEHKKAAGYRGVVYYDRNYNAYCLLKTEDPESPIKLENTSEAQISAASGGLKYNEIFVYYDEIRTTGSDFKLDPGADAILTCDVNRTTKRSLFQGALRLRQFLSAQRIHFVVKGETTDEETMAVGDRFWNIYDRCSANQNAGLSPDKVYRAYVAQLSNRARILAEKKLMSYVKSPIYWSLLRHHNWFFIPSRWYNDFKRCYDSYEKLTFRQTDFDPLTWYQPSMQKSAAKCLEAKRAHLAALLPEDLRSAFIDDTTNLLSEAIGQLGASHIATTTGSGDRGGAEMGQEVEQEQEQEQEKQQINQQFSNTGDQQIVQEILPTVDPADPDASLSDTVFAGNWGLQFMSEILGELQRTGGMTVVSQARRMLGAMNDRGPAGRRDSASTAPWTYLQILSNPSAFMQAVVDKIKENLGIADIKNHPEQIQNLKSTQNVGLLKRLIKLLALFTNSHSMTLILGIMMNIPSMIKELSKPRNENDTAIAGLLGMIDKALSGVSFKSKIGKISDNDTVSIEDLRGWLKNDFGPLAEALGLGVADVLKIDDQTVELKDVTFETKAEGPSSDTQTPSTADSPGSDEPVSPSGKPKHDEHAAEQSMSFRKALSVVVKQRILNTREGEPAPTSTDGFKTGLFTKGGKSWRILIKNNEKYALMEAETIRPGRADEAVPYPSDLVFHHLKRDEESNIICELDTPSGNTKPGGAAKGSAPKKTGTDNTDEVVKFYYGKDPSPDKPAHPLITGDDYKMLCLALEMALNLIPTLQGEKGQVGFAEAILGTTKNYAPYCYALSQRVVRFDESLDDILFVIDNNRGIKNREAFIRWKLAGYPELPGAANVPDAEKTLTYAERREIYLKTGKMPSGSQGKKSKRLYEFIMNFTQTYFPLMSGGALAANIAAGERVDTFFNKNQQAEPAIRDLNQDISETSAEDSRKNLDLFSKGIQISPGMRTVFASAPEYYFTNKYCGNAVIYSNEQKEMKILLVSAAEAERIQHLIQDGTLKYAWLINECGEVLSKTPLKAECERWRLEHPGSQQDGQLMDHLDLALREKYGIDEEIECERRMNEKLDEARFNLALYNGNLQLCKQMTREWKKIVDEPKKLQFAQDIAASKQRQG